MSLRGVKVVALQEFRVRLRSGRWRWLLGAWFVVVGLFTFMLETGLNATQTYYNSGSATYNSFENPKGPPMFGWLMFFVLALMLVISPTLTAQSVNGERERGTLATLQVTLLTPGEIAIGKLLAAWSIGLVALALTLPYVVWAVAMGGVGPFRTIVTLVVAGVLIGVVCALSQALSALIARSITSALLSYLTVFALTVGTLIVWGLATMMTQETVPVSHTDPNQQTYTYNEQITHPEETWWLLAPNPFVVLADSAPGLPPFRDPMSGQVVYRSGDVMGSLRDTVRTSTLSQADRSRDYNVDRLSPVWPWGLGFDLLLGGGAVWVTTRRLRSPADRLPKGVRIA